MARLAPSSNGSNIHERVIEEMRRRIISGEFEAGVNLSEISLAESFGVSRTPVREALKKLQTEGLVTIRPRVGTFVTAPSRREITELFEMKELLEGAGARLFAQRGRVPELDLLEQNLVASDGDVAADDRGSYAGHVHDFHDLVIAGADNEKLAAHYRTLMNQLAYPRLVVASLSSHPGRAFQSAQEHHRVFDMIVAKDGDSAERVMREHVRASRTALMAALDLRNGSEIGSGEIDGLEDASAELSCQ